MFKEIGVGIYIFLYFFVLSIGDISYCVGRSFGEFVVFFGIYIFVDVVICRFGMFVLRG